MFAPGRPGRRAPRAAVRSVKSDTPAFRPARPRSTHPPARAPDLQAGTGSRHHAGSPLADSFIFLLLGASPVSAAWKGRAQDAAAVRGVLEPRLQEAGGPPAAAATPEPARGPSHSPSLAARELREALPPSGADCLALAHATGTHGPMQTHGQSRQSRDRQGGTQTHTQIKMEEKLQKNIPSC